jgi:formate dehydrogenase major subunit
MPVMQPSEWQQAYSRFNALQEELLSKRLGNAAAEAAVAK